MIDFLSTPRQCQQPQIMRYRLQSTLGLALAVNRSSWGCSFIGLKLQFLENKTFLIIFANELQKIGQNIPILPQNNHIPIQPPKNPLSSQIIPLPFSLHSPRPLILVPAMVIKRQKKSIQQIQQYIKKMKLKVSLPKTQFQSYKQIDSRWSEIKMNNAFTARQAFAFCAQGDIGYLHGGYNCDQGLLKDMFMAKFDDPDDRQWHEIVQKGNLPGKLRYHTLTSYLCYILCVGGQRSQIENNNQIFYFNLQNQTWSTLDIVAEDPTVTNAKIKSSLGRDSHCSIVYGKNLYIFGGYLFSQGLYSNEIIKINLERISEGKATFKSIKIDANNAPKPRSNFASCILGDSLYIFGGTNSLEFFDDFWKFDCNHEVWQDLTQQQSGRFFWPEKRKGAVLVPYFQVQSLILFGGMQTITKQQNDLSIYSISKNSWVKVHSNTNNIYDPSPTLKGQPEISPTINYYKIKKQEKDKEKGQFRIGVVNATTSSNFSQGQITGNNTGNNKLASGKNYKSVIKSEFNNKVCKTQSSFSRPHEDEGKQVKTAFNTKSNFFDRKGQPQTKMSVVQQKKYRQFLARKKRLLSEIYSGYRGQKTKRPYSPTSECLNYTLNQLGEQHQFVQSKNPEFQLPKVIFDDKKSQVIGKKPCARDGHAAFCINKNMYIIGGDRHMVSFNDTHLLRMDKAMQSMSYYS